MAACRPRKVMIVNTSDSGGGAERVSMDLLEGFEALGTEAWMAVGAKHGNHPRVMPLYASPHLHYTRDHPLRRARRNARKRLDHRLGLEDFNHPYTDVLPELSGSRPDVLLCNNLHGGFFDLRKLPQLSLQLPIVLRLADSWLFTGHCAVPGPCERWRTGCGRCPDLATPPAIQRDATRLNWQRKRWILARSRVHLAAPSTWMMERVMQSTLGPAIVDSRVIPNGVDLATFSPEGESAPGPSDGAARLVFAANGGAANPHKDFATLRASLRRLEGPVELVSVGGEIASEDLGGGIRIRHEAELSSGRLAALYRSADLYVHASAQESFSLTAAEALACGTPVVAASEGGIADVLQHGRSGMLVSPGDERGMSAALERLLGDHELRARMSGEGAAQRWRFDRDRMVGEMHDFCAEAVQAWGP